MILDINRQMLLFYFFLKHPNRFIQPKGKKYKLLASDATFMKNYITESIDRLNDEGQNGTKMNQTKNQILGTASNPYKFIRILRNFHANDDPQKVVDATDEEVNKFNINKKN